MSTNQIAKFVSAVANGQKIRKNSIIWPHTKSILEVAKILKTEGYVSHFLFCETDGKKSLEIFLKNGTNINSSISLVSRPSALKYFSKKDIWKLSTKIGIFVLSTPLGVLSDREAKMLGTGGKVLLYIC